MNNVAPTPMMDANSDPIIRAADFLIAMTRAHGRQKGQLDLETNTGETWRITIERIGNVFQKGDIEE